MARKTGTPRTFERDGISFTYELIFSRRVSLGIQIQPDAHVIVRAPLGAKQSEIDTILATRAAWITKHQTRILAHPRAATAPLGYTSGSTLRYMGNDLILAVNAHSRSQITLLEHTLFVHTPTPIDANAVKKLVHGWFLSQARTILPERVTACLPLVAPLGIGAPTHITIRDMRTRWGSCSGQGRVSLNAKLIQLELALIDYVVIHELCHLRELNHGRGFYALMDTALPGWQKLRAHIRQHRAEW